MAAGGDAMKTLFLGSLLLMLAPAAALADDGSWSDFRGYTPAEGPLYSEPGNPAIALEKEYLELSDYEAGSTKAVFLFRNASSSPVVAECAFPVRIEWGVAPIKFDLAGKRTEESGPKIRRGWDYGAGSKYSAQAKGPYSVTVDDWISALGVETSTWEPDEPDWGGTFIPESGYPTGRRDIPLEPFLGTLSLVITQDGKNVPMTGLVADFGEVPGLITLHFRHKLSFAAGAASHVEVGYAFPGGSAASGDPMTPGHVDSYAWKYVLETGASWKGPIGSLLLSLPPDFSGNIPAALKPLGAVGSRLLYRAESWEPGAKDNLDLSWSEIVLTAAEGRPIWVSSPRYLDFAGYSAPEEGVKVLRSSSSLPDKADAYVARGVLSQTPYDAARLFDGLRETPWVEGRPDDGVGEYVVFAVDRPMCLVAVQNGYLRSPVDIPEKATWSYFEKNNRVKELELRKDDGEKVARLALADSRELQYFAVDLVPGTYRAVIASVYPGSKWKDTCLGELRFYPGVAGGVAEVARLAKDEFFGPCLKK
jgi:hypothetical protein